ncbi:helix-turn-helix transcriptional regulator [Acaryochloris thomasi]|uniref:helix-turn-helix transcriptional regulator n=1 Tax=Acaryochloris thomasi TaxID=2929456 RepID=UPI0028F43300|nr:helix-turn-helix transcriptional regulator [Acaryochloris thomasi]
MGLTPHQYVIHQRIECAKGLLVKEKMAISDAAYAMGFSHQSHFTRHFKRQVGVTPKQFLARS